MVTVVSRESCDCVAPSLVSGVSWPMRWKRAAPLADALIRADSPS